MNNKYIELAIKEAEKACKKGEVPVGAVIVKDNKIISKAHNTIEKDNNPIKHAEIKAIEKATKKLNNWRLNDCELYVTLEPCDMCRGAIKNARISNIYYILSKKENVTEKAVYKEIKLYQNQYLELLQNFFKKKRV